MIIFQHYGKYKSPEQWSCFAPVAEARQLFSFKILTIDSFKNVFKIF